MPVASKGAKQTRGDSHTVTTTAVLERVEGRISQIEGHEKITPWNKAKLMAFKEVRVMLNPPAPEETPAVPEPETAASEPDPGVEPDPEPAEEVVEQSYAPLEDEA